jgi:glycerol kinase
VSYLLAIDQGTSSTKVVLYDREFRVLGKASRAHGQHSPEPSWLEHDAVEIWQNLIDACRELLESHPECRSEIEAIAITNQRETIVVFDKEHGVPLHSALVWQCRRGDQICEEQISLGRDPVVRKRTGLRIDGYFSASKISWVMRNEPGLARKIQLGSALIGTIDTYLIYRLTGGRVFATDHTNASRTLLYDIRRQKWDPELCAWWQVPMGALPLILPCDARFGVTTLGGLLGRAVPIHGVMGDSQASMFAHRCFEPGSAKVTFGSGSSVLLNIGDTPKSPDKAVTSLAWVQGKNTRYAFEGMSNCCASTFTWLRDQMGMVADTKEAEELAKTTEQSHGVYLVPAFSGLGAPYWRHGARAAIVGLTAHSDRRHIARAAFEAMSYQVRDVLDMVKIESGIQVHSLRCDGGPTASDFLMQFTADVLGIELEVSEDPHCSALGAARMAALGIGWYSDTRALAALPTESRTYRRTRDAGLVDHDYRGWQQAVQQVLCVV